MTYPIGEARLPRLVGVAVEHDGHKLVHGHHLCQWLGVQQFLGARTCDGTEGDQLKSARFTCCRPLPA